MDYSIGGPVVYGLTRNTAGIIHSQQASYPVIYMQDYWTCNNCIATY